VKIYESTRYASARAVARNLLAEGLALEDHMPILHVSLDCDLRPIWGYEEVLREIYRVLCEHGGLPRLSYGLFSNYPKDLVDGSFL
jgi:hypothetical protein